MSTIPHPKTATVAAAKPCDCYQQVQENLKAQGLSISDKCKSFRLTNNTLSSCIGFPLQTTDGKRLKRGQPSMIFISFCPFCGTEQKGAK